MSRAVLDTSVLIADDIPPIRADLAISAVSLAELHFGVLVAKTPDTRAVRLSRLSSVERRFAALPVDEAVADSYGLLAARLMWNGRQPRSRVMDLLIAATAHAHGASLYTRNSSDLEGLEDLVKIVPV